MRGRKTDANQAALVRALKQAGCWVTDLSGVGGGCPDLLVFSPVLRKWVLLEVKDGSKPKSAQKLTEAQVEFHRDCPGPVFVVTNLTEALAVLGIKENACA